MICAQDGWNWHSGSGEDDFLKSSMYFHYLIIISPWKKEGPFIYKKSWISFIQGWFVPSLAEIGPVVLEKKMKMCKVYDNDDEDGQRTNFAKKNSLEPSAQVS